MPEEIVGPHTDAWQRHDLLHVVPRAWAAALATHSLGDVPFLPQWADRGWPVIVRRRLESEAPDVVPVGVPLPPAAGKSRIALNVPPAAVTARAAPTSLRTVAPKAVPAWQPTIAALVVLGERHGIEPAAFGSLLWEHHTGLTLSVADIGSRCDLVGTGGLPHRQSAPRDRADRARGADAHRW